MKPLERVYESHITWSREDAEKVKELGFDVNWKYSQIDGDPVLGAGVFCYLSAHNTDLGFLDLRMNNIVERAIERGIPPVRSKIEEILFDSRWEGKRGEL